MTVTSLRRHMACKGLGVMIRGEGVLAGHAGLSAFYQRFLHLPETQDLIATGGRMPRKFDQYWAK